MTRRNKHPAKRGKLATTLALTFFGLCATALVIAGSLQLASSARTHQAVISSRQQLVARGAARAVSSFVEDKLSVLQTTIWLTALPTLSPAEQDRILSGLLDRQSAIRWIALLNAEEQVAAQASRLPPPGLETLLDRLPAAARLGGRDREQRVGNVYFDPVTREPLVILAVPVTDPLGDWRGSLVAEVNLKFMWTLVEQLRVGDRGCAYVVDRQGHLIAFDDTVRVLRGESVQQLNSVREFLTTSGGPASPRVQAYRGIRGEAVLGTYAEVGQPDWAVVTELPRGEAYQGVLAEAAVFLTIILITSALAGLLGVSFARRVTVPLVHLTETAERIAAGERELRAPVSGPQEVAGLAEAFNSMTGQVQQSVSDLEAQITEVKQAEAAVQAKTEELDRYFTNALDLLCIADTDGCFRRLNKEWQTVLGYTLEELENTRFTDYVHPDDLEATLAATARLAEQREVLNFTNRYRCKDGTYRWIEWRSLPAGKLIYAAARDVTDRKRLEEALRQSEEKFAKAFRSSPHSVTLTRISTGEILDVNDGFEDMFGYTREEATGKTALSLGLYADPEDRNRLIREVEHTGRVREMEVEGRRKSGERFSALISVEATELGGEASMVTTVRDITERKRAEEALRESEQRFRAIFHSTYQFTGLMTPEGILTEVNQTALDFAGVTIEEVINRPFWETYWWRGDKTHVRQLREHISRAAQGEFIRYEVMVQGAGESKAIIDFSIKPVFDATHRVVLLIPEGRDITERKQAEAAVRESQERLALALEGANLGSWDADVRTGRVRVNERYAQMLGYAPDEIEPHLHSWETLVHPEDLPRMREELRSHLEGRTPFYEMEHRMRHKSGAWVWVLDRGKVIERDVADKPMRAAGTHLDITERKRTEAALLESEQRFRRLAEAAFEGIVLIREGIIEDCNDRMAEMLGYQRDELRGRSVLDCVSPEHREAVARHMAQDQIEPYEHHALRKDGTTFPVEARARAATVGGDKLRMTAVRDLTERKRTEQLIRVRLRLMEFAATHSLGELLQKTLDEVEELTGSPVGFFHFVEGDQKTLSLQAWSTQTRAAFCQADGEGLHYAIDQAGVWTDCVRERRPVIHNDYASLPHRKGLPEGHAPVIRELVVPILRDDRIVAILGIGNKPRPYTEADTSVVQFVADLAWEITERKRVEEALFASRQMLRTVLDTIPTRVFWKDRHSVYVGCNAAFARDHGVADPSVLIGKTDDDTMTAALSDRYRADDRRVMETGESKLTFEEPQVRLDGSQGWLLTNKVPLRNARGDIVGVLGTYEDITERKRAEAALRDSEAFLDTVIEHNPRSMWVSDDQGTLIRMNQACRDLLRVTNEELVGKYNVLEDNIVEEQGVMPLVKRVFEQGEPVQFTLRYDSARLGSLRLGAATQAVLDVAISPVLDAQNRVVHAIVQHLDITERTRAESALRESEERLRLALEGTSQGLYDLNLQTGQAVVTDEYARMLGYEPGETAFSADWWRQQVHPDDLERAVRTLGECVQGERNEYRMEYRLRTKSGDWKWILSLGRVVQSDPQGRPVRMLGTHLDITERKRAEEAIRTSEASLAHAQRLAHLGSWEIDLVHDSLQWSEETFRIMGVTPETFTPTQANFQALVHPEDQEQTSLAVTAALCTRQPYVLDHRIVRPDGSVRIVSERAEVVLGPEGEPIRLVGTVQDVTERKQAEAALERERRFTNAVLDSVPGLLYLYDDQGRLVRWNKQHETLTGYSAEELAQMTLLDWYRGEPEEAARIAAAVQRIPAEGHAEEEAILVTKGGQRIPFYFTAVALRIDRQDYFVGIGIDITERRRAEEALRRSEANLQLALEAGRLGDWSWDVVTGEVAWSSRCKALYGLPPETVMTYERFLERVHPEDRERVDATLRQAVEARSDYDVEKRAVWPDGSVHWNATRGRVFCNAAGKPVRVAGVTLDITERKLADEALRESEERFRHIFEHSRAVMMLIDPASGTIAEANSAAAHFYGYPRETLRRMAIEDINQLPPEQVRAARECVCREECDDLIFPHRLASGEIRTVEVRSSPVNVSGRRLLFSIVQDVTERKRAEAALEKRIVALTQPLDAPGGIAFEDLFNPADIQRLQDLFAGACGVASIITHPDGTPITQPSNFCALCNDIIRRTEKGLKNCYCSDAILGRHNPAGPVVQPCLSGGLWDAGASITVGGRHVANWLIGQVRNEAQSEERMMAYAREIGADEPAFLEAFRKVPKMSREQFEQVAQALFAVASQLSTTAYQNIQQARFIAERKRAEEALQREKQFSESLIDSMPGILYLFDEQGHFVRWNKQFEQTSDYTGQEISHLDPTAFFLGPDRERIIQAIQEVFRAGTAYVEASLVTKDGRSIPHYFTGLRTFIGNRPHVLGVGLDISERKRAEAQSARLQALLKAVIAQSPVPMVLALADGTVELFNEACREVLGVEDETHLQTGVNLFSLDQSWTQYDAQGAQIASQDVPLAQALRGKITRKQEIKVVRKDGTERWILTDAVPIHDDPGAVIAGFLVFPDITERKQAEEALRLSEQKFRSFVETTKEWIWIVDTEGKHTFSNPAVEAILGYAPVDLLGRLALDLVHPEDQNTVAKLLQNEAVLRTGWSGVVLRWRHKDGSYRFLESSAVPAFDARGRYVGFQGTDRDITERKRAETQLERSLRETRVRFELSQALAGAETEDGVLDVLIQHAGLYPLAHVALLTLDRTQDEPEVVLRRLAAFGSGVPNHIPPGTRLPASTIQMFRLLSSSQPFVSNNLWTDERLDDTSRAFFHPSGAVSHGVFPITSGNEWLGFIAVTSRVSDYFDEDKQHLYQTLAEQGAVALRAARLREAVRESQQRFQLLVETLSDLVWEIDENGVYTYVSPRVRVTLGYEPEEVVGKTPFAFMASDEARRVAGLFGPVLEARRPLAALENTVRRKDGRPVVLETNGLPFFDAEGRFKGYRGAGRDITERKEASERVRRLVNEQRTILNTTSVGIALLRSWRLEWMNPAFTAMFGYEPQELQGRDSLIFYANPEEYQTVGREGYDQLARGLIHRTEVNFKKKDGTLFWCELTGQAVNTQDLSEGSIWVLHDITERKRAGETLAQERELLSTVINLMPDSIYVKDRDSRFLLANRTLATRMGKSRPEEVVGLSDRDFFPPEIAADNRAIEERVLAGEALHDHESPIVLPTGEALTLLTTKVPLQNRRGEIVGLVGVGRNITERKRIEEERERLIRELEAKNAELERFTYTVSHDLKSPLITIKGFAGALLRDVAANRQDRVTDDLKRIANATDKMAELLSDLLELSRIGRMMNPPSAVNLEALTREVLELLAGPITTAGVQVVVQPGLPEVFGDRRRLQEVLQNLIENAVRFRGDQPKPCVEIGMREDRGTPVFFVRDNGMGVESRYHGTVFGLFNKLDARSEGTGIGLALVRRIIEVHGGRVWLESEGPGQGSTFYFTLPTPPQLRKEQQA